jgi:hypothetical protein
MMLP